MHYALISAVHQAQADALEIEARAKRRLADEYDAAQERKEVVGHGGDRSKVAASDLATIKDIGLSKQELHEARQIRDAEKAEPGIVKRGNLPLHRIELGNIGNIGQTDVSS